MSILWVFCQTRESVDKDSIRRLGDMSINCLRDRVSPVPNSKRGRGLAGAPA
jgi:hypothetical protein